MNPKTITVTQASGLSTGLEKASESEIILYPVPLKDKLFISTSNMILPKSVTICSISGTEVYSTEITNSITVVDMNKFPSGLYIVKIFNPDNSILIKKILKQ